MKNVLIFAMLILPAVMFAQGKFSFYFDSGKDMPNSASVKEFATWRTENKVIFIENIYGYTDSIGSANNNLNLSLRRAKAIKQLIIDSNCYFINDLEVKGLGEIVTGKTDFNRKVDIHFVINKPLSIKRVDDIPAGNKRVQIPAEDTISVTTQNILTKEIKASKIGDKFILRNVRFYGGTSVVTVESKPVLDELTQILKDNPNLKIEIQGHICCQKKDNEAELTSQLRAKSIYNYLIRRGISKTRLSSHGMEGLHPIYPIPEKNEEERMANRRVEISIISN